MNEFEIKPKDEPLDILIVEDDEVSGKLLTDILATTQHRVTLKTTAEEAFQMLTLQSQADEKETDIILLDVHLPNMGGEEFCRHVRRLNPRQHRPNPLPWVIAHTSDTKPLTIEDLLEAGANDYLPKPVDPSWLLLKIRVAQYNIARISALKIQLHHLERFLLQNHHKIFPTKD